MVGKKAKHVNISSIPELLRLAKEVEDSGEPCILQINHEDIVQITPLKPKTKQRAKVRLMTRDDPLSNLIGIGESEEPEDVSSNIHKYVAEAYLHHNKDS
ncbi:MAG: hypothetical protein EXR50_03085 [Dehalococcoidia bacterium]|nr:hypothetical protein [Dehalococcoidia bacterium]